MRCMNMHCWKYYPKERSDGRNKEQSDGSDGRNKDKGTEVTEGTRTRGRNNP